MYLHGDEAVIFLQHYKRNGNIACLFRKKKLLEFSLYCIFMWIKCAFIKKIETPSILIYNKKQKSCEISIVVGNNS